MGPRARLDGRKIWPHPYFFGIMIQLLYFIFVSVSDCQLFSSLRLYESHSSCAAKVCGPEYVCVFCAQVFSFVCGSSLDHLTHNSVPPLARRMCVLYPPVPSWV